MNAPSILDNVRVVPSVVESLLVKSGLAIPREAFLASPSAKAWFQTLNLPSYGSPIVEIRNHTNVRVEWPIWSDEP